jgi:uncharacterized protein (DUF58 family)
MSVMIVLDSSASMNFPETAGQAGTKFRYGCIIAAALAYLISTQGDAVGLMSMSDDQLAYVPARGGRVQLRSLLARLDRLTPAGSWQPQRIIASAAELLDRRGVVLVISDFYDAEEETWRELRRVVRRGHDVAMLQVISAAERAFPFRDNLEFQDLESGERRLLDAGAVAQTYRAAMADFLARCRTLAQRDGIDYALISTDDRPETSLRAFLLRRNSRQAPDNAKGA